MKRSLRLASVALAALLLAGCSAQSGASTPSGVVAPAQAPEIKLDGGAGEADQGFSSEIGEQGSRAIVTTGTVSITADDPIAAASDTTTIVLSESGRVDSRTEQPASDTVPARASLVIRVPSDQLDSALEKIKSLGTVNSVSLNSSDVTQQKQDLSARITALQTSVDRLLDLMTKAADTADLIVIEQALSARQSELDSLTAQREFLDDQIDYSTLTVEFVSEGTVASSGPDSFWDGLLVGWNGLLAFLGGFVVVLGVVLPWLLILGVLAALVVAIVAASRRRSRRRAAAEPHGQATATAAAASPAPPVVSDAAAPQPTPSPLPDEDVQQ